MAGDNLTVTFGADASKLRSEIKFVSAEMKNLDKQINAAFKAGDTGRARDLSNTFGALQTKTIGLNNSLKGTAGALDQVTAAGRRTEAQFRRISFSANSIGRLVSGFGGGVGGGLFGFAAAAGAREVIKALDDTIERLDKIRDIARETAQKPAAVAAGQNIARAAGESTDAVDTAMKTQAEAFSQLIQRQRAALGASTPEQQAKQKELQDARARLLGAGPIVGGEKQAALDLANVYEILTVNAKRYKDTQADLARFQNDIDTMFLKIANSGRLGNTQLNELAKAIYKVDSGTVLSFLPQKVAKFNAEIAKTEGPLNEAEAALKRMREEQGKLANTTQEATQEAAVNYAKLKTAIAVTAQEIIKTGITNFGDLEGRAAATAGQATGKAFKDAFTAVLSPGDPEALGAAETSKAIGQAFTGLPPVFQGITKTIGDLWDGLWKHLSISAQAAEMSTAKSAQAMSNSFKQAAAAAQGAISAIQGALNMAQGAAQLAAAAKGAAGGTSGAGGFGVDVFRGGIGDQGGHGPASRPTQSITPGLSDYQAPPHQTVYPSASATYGSQHDFSAATMAAEAALAAKSAAEATKTAVQGWVDPPFNAFAGGGMIRGSGSGTSDSIMARVSNGEFVMRAAAVRHWGAGLMSNLNRFAGGGMVMPSRGVPSFADGGLVAAGGGTGRAVHLHLGGHEFALSGASSVVDSLVTAASQQRMRSGGLKPSWYGGRASG